MMSVGEGEEKVYCTVLYCTVLYCTVLYLMSVGEGEEEVCQMEPAAHHQLHVLLLALVHRLHRQQAQRLLQTPGYVPVNIFLGFTNIFLGFTNIFCAVQIFFVLNKYFLQK